MDIYITLATLKVTFLDFLYHISQEIIILLILFKNSIVHITVVVIYNYIFGRSDKDLMQNQIKYLLYTI